MRVQKSNFFAVFLRELINHRNNQKAGTQSAQGTKQSRPYTGLARASIIHVVNDNKPRKSGYSLKGIKNQKGGYTDFLKGFVAQCDHNTTAKIVYRFLKIHLFSRMLMVIFRLIDKGTKDSRY